MADRPDFRSKNSSRVKLAFVDDDQKPEDDDEKRATRPKSKKRHGHKKTGKHRKDAEKIHFTATFTLGNISVDITLDDQLLSWCSAESSSSGSKKFKDQDDRKSIDLRDAYSITPILETNYSSATLNNRTSQNGNATAGSSGSGKFRGFEIQVIERNPTGELKNIVITFQSDLPEQIEEWFTILQKIITKLKPKRDLLVLCNSFAGTREGTLLYQNKIKPTLERANFEITYAEIDQVHSIESQFKIFEDNFEKFFGVVVIGGDGSVIQVINALLNFTATANQINLTRETHFPEFPFPLCIIPAGTTNLIATTIYGHTEQNYGLLHLLIDQRIRIDMSAVFDDEDNFVTSCFTAGAGFPAKILELFSNYSGLTAKKVVRKSIFKATSKKNLKSIRMEIRYIPVEPSNLLSTRCYHNCACFSTIQSESSNEVLAFDETHLNKRITCSKSSGRTRKSSKSLNSNDSPWKSVQGEFSETLVLTNAGLWHFAPQGLSKFGHLGDGLLHFVIVATHKRKDFVRFLKRHGNSKNQFDLPFVNFGVAKEIQINLLSMNSADSNSYPPSNNQTDSSASENSSLEDSDDEKVQVPSKAQKNQLPPKPPTQVKKKNRNKDDSDNDNDRQLKDNSTLSFNSAGRRYSFSSKNHSRHDSSAERNDESKKRRSSIFNTSDKNSSKTNEVDRRRLSISALSTTSDSRTKDYNFRSIPFGNEKKNCVWNLDFNSCDLMSIRIKCLHQFLPVFGSGVIQSSDQRIVYYPCL